MKLAALACAALLLADRPAEACSCLPPPPPCQAYSRVPAVFVGEVTSVTTAQDFVVTTTFAIEEQLKGSFPTGTVSILGGGMCSATFERGQKYFVYAFEADGNWHAGLCGRTRRLDRAAEDLAHARNLPKRQLAELLGTVRIADEQDQLTPRAGATVIAQGTPHSTKTDASGRYALQVPPGKYTLDVIDPGTRVATGKLPTVEITDPSACASEDITLRWNGRIRGKLVDHAGRPAAGVPVWAHGPGPTSAIRAVTSATGEYEIQGVQAGEHLVAVNHLGNGGPDPSSPIPTTYYPGVSAEADAKLITMVRSGLVSNIDFKLPKPLPIYAVTGVVKQKGKQGKPVPAVRVWLSTELGPRYNRLVSAQTDARGRFALKELAGAKVSLEVCLPDASPPDPVACRTVRNTLTKDWTVDLEYPSEP